MQLNTAALVLCTLSNKKSKQVFYNITITVLDIIHRPAFYLVFLNKIQDDG
jgi:hypothetical protein